MAEPQGPPSPQDQEEPIQLDLDFQNIVDEQAAIQGQMVSQLTKDLASQRAISTALQKKVKELIDQIHIQQEVIARLEVELHPEKKPIENLEQAERVLDDIAANGAAARSNGDKPAAKEIPSSARPTRPPVKEKT